jgi:2,4-didehydro-3-deoxy-L-rhamnonate hydrolase
VVEVVAVVGRPARNVDAANAWSYVSGLSIGQDISERVLTDGFASTRLIR